MGFLHCLRATVSPTPGRSGGQPARSKARLVQHKYDRFFISERNFEKRTKLTVSAPLRGVGVPLRVNSREPIEPRCALQTRRWSEERHIEHVLTTIALGIVAALYAAVGQAGATGYLAVMGVAGLDSAIMKPTALALNILVAAIGTWQYARAGRFSWETFYPFAVLGFPFSFIGGAIDLPGGVYYPIVGAILLFAAFQTARSVIVKRQVEVSDLSPPFKPALLTGAGIGFVSGMTGTGGGIFLAPILIMTGWVGMRRAAAVTAAYNLLNSAAALAGSYASLKTLPSTLPVWMLITGIGAIFGSAIGSRYVPERGLRSILAVLLLGSGAKLLFS